MGHPQRWNRGKTVLLLRFYELGRQDHHSGDHITGILPLMPLPSSPQNPGNTAVLGWRSYYARNVCPTEVWRRNLNFRILSQEGEWCREHYGSGLNWTGHMSFLTGKDQTSKCAGQVLPDRTKSGLTFYIPNNRISVKFIKLKQKKNWKKKLKIF